MGIKIKSQILRYIALPDRLYVIKLEKNYIRFKKNLREILKIFIAKY